MSLPPPESMMIDGVLYRRIESAAFRLHIRYGAIVKLIKRAGVREHRVGFHRYVCMADLVAKHNGTSADVDRPAIQKIDTGTYVRIDILATGYDMDISALVKIEEIRCLKAHRTLYLQEQDLKAWLMNQGRALGRFSS